MSPRIACRGPHNRRETDSSLRVGSRRIRKDAAGLCTGRVYHLKEIVFRINVCLGHYQLSYKLTRHKYSLVPGKVPTFTRYLGNIILMYLWV